MQQTQLGSKSTLHPLVQALALAQTAWASAEWDGIDPIMDAFPYSVVAERLGTSIRYRATILFPLGERQRMEAVVKVAGARLGLCFDGCGIEHGSTVFRFSQREPVTLQAYESVDASGEPTAVLVPGSDLDCVVARAIGAMMLELAS